VVARLTIVKVGGSLFDLPGLGPRLGRWLAGLAPADALLVPGGGAAAHVVRDLDRRHGLGEEKSHWLALRALALNARFLADLLPGVRVVDSPADHRGGLAVLDPLAFCLADKRDNPADALPHCWAVTSDSVAARVAVAAGARRLVLLKSVTVPPAMSWTGAARAGYVDATFPGVVRAAPGLEVDAVNFRAGDG
jgi:aspartokinase-like uncharacterized kinase